MGKSKRKRSRSRSRSRESKSSRKDVERRLRKLETLLEKTLQDGGTQRRGHIMQNTPKSSRDRSPRGSTRDRGLDSPASRRERGLSGLVSTRRSRSRSRRFSSTDRSWSSDRSPRGSTGTTHIFNQGPRTLTPDNSENVQPQNVLVINNNETLDDEAIQYLGEDPLTQRDNTLELHTAIASRWSHILSLGLEKKVKEELIQKYPPPSNLQELKAPLLNQEVLPILASHALKRDKYQMNDQNQLSAGLTALGAGINFILENNEDPIRTKSLPVLGDAARLLVDLHHNVSVTRRAFITPSLNKSAKDLIEGTPIDKFLFGVDFGDRCKSIKAIERTSNEIKSTQQGNKNTTFKKAKPAVPNIKHNSSLNWKGPSRHQREAKKGHPNPSHAYQRQSRHRKYQNRY